MSSPIVDLVPGESVLKVEGVSRANILFATILIAVVFALFELALTFVFAALQPMVVGLGLASVQRWAQVMALFVGGAALVFIAAWLYSFLLALSTRYTLTDRRLVAQKGLVARHMAQAELACIQDVRMRQDFIGRILHYGHVSVETAGTAGLVALRFVADPVGWTHAINASSAQSAQVGTR